MPAMNRRLRPGRSADDDRIHRFLRPGALAQLRDSRISARSPRSGSKVHLLLRLPPSSPSASASPSPDQIDGPPCLAARAYGPRYLLRKKLVAPKYLSFQAPSPSSPAAAEPSDQMLDFFGGADLVAAH